jgi:hypothetical protein
MAMLEEATEAQIPFVGESVSLTNPAMLATTAVSLILGFALFSMAEGIGEQVASSVNATLASLLGMDVGDANDDNGVPGV